MSVNPTTTATSNGGPFVPPSVDELDAILSQFEFVEFLGQGGMGAVYKARQPKLDRMVAIKILPMVASDSDDDEARHAERFRKEALAMAKLNHCHIVPVHDFGTTSDGHLYFVMDFIDGTDLYQVIKTKQCTVDRVLDWVPQICDALQYAHGEGIIHRDIKPSNILIDQEGVVKVADFGIAKLTGDRELTQLTKTNMTMGSPDYLAPESLQDDVELDSRADLFALGVMLYQMLTGTVPRGAWQPPSVINPEVDERFDDLVVRAMDPHRETRCQHATEIAEVVFAIQADAAQQEPGSPRPVIKKLGPVASAPGSGPRTKTGPITSRKGTGSFHTAPVPPPAIKPDGHTRPVAPIPAAQEKPAEKPAVEKGRWPISVAAAIAILGAVGGILYMLFASK